jgi:hypothetical protein
MSLELVLEAEYISFLTVKFFFAPYNLKSLFFVHFSFQKWQIFTSAKRGTIKIAICGCHIFFNF